MDAMTSTAGALAVTTPPPPPPPPPSEVAQGTKPVRTAGGASTKPFDHALLQGEGGKRGILKRMEPEDIETVQSELGLRAQAAAQDYMAVEMPRTDPVDTVPVEAANVSPPPVGLQLPEAPQAPFDVSELLPEPGATPTSDTAQATTTFVHEAGFVSDPGD